jgi:hypothetical protein
MGSRRSRAAGPSDAEELAVYRAFVRQLTETCEAAARGDLEARSRPDREVRAVPELRALHHALNGCSTCPMPSSGSPRPH